MQPLFPRSDEGNDVHNQGGDDRNLVSLAKIIALDAAIIMLLAVIMAFKSKRFRGWVSSLPIWTFFKKALGSILPRFAAREVSNDTSLNEIPVAGRAVANNPPDHNTNTGGGDRAPQVEGPPTMRRPQPVFTLPRRQR